jgi:magnesium transporter
VTVTCRLYRNGRLDPVSPEEEAISDVLSEKDALLWVDIEGPTQQTIDMLGREFGFHPLALEDCLHAHQRPKVEQYETYFFLVAYALAHGPEGLVHHEMAAFVSKKYLVTVRKEPVFDLSQVIARWSAHSELVEEGGGYLLYVLLDEIVDGYFDALDAYEDRTESVEERILETTAEMEDQAEIFRLKKELVAMRRVMAPLRDVLDVLQRRLIDVVTAPLEPYYRDVYDHVLRATDFADSIRDILSTALEVYLSVVSNRLNVIMKRLTGWAGIILVPTLIAGIYGMNFLNMPELRWRFGYLFALGLMLASGLLLWRAFKRRDWL